MSLTSASPLAAAGRSAPPAPPAPPGRPLAGLSDDEVLRGLGRLLAQSRRAESDLVAHIAEVDERRLWAREAFPSRFAYCTGALHLSESEAYLRITVGRASRVHPAVLGVLAEGRMHLSGIALLAPHLTPENVEDLLAQATFRSKREIEELVAAIAPRPDVPATIRKLPTRAASIAPPPAEIDGSASSVGKLPVAVAAPSAASTDSSAATTTLSGMGRTVTQVGPSAAPGSSPPSDQTLPPRPFHPLAHDRYKVQFTAAGALVRKLERLCALMGSRSSGCDLAAVIDAVVSEKLERLEARRFGARSRHDETRKTGGSPSVGPATPVARDHAPPASRHVPARVRRVVFDRDGGRCTYLDAAGRRCPEFDRLEYHHCHPFGVGGSHRPENLRLMCRAHNTVEAEHDFGRRTMDRYRRSQAEDPRPPPLARTAARADRSPQRRRPLTTPACGDGSLERRPPWATATARGGPRTEPCVRRRPARTSDRRTATPVRCRPQRADQSAAAVPSAPAGGRLSATAHPALDSPTR